MCRLEECGNKEVKEGEPEEFAAASISKLTRINGANANTHGDRPRPLALHSAWAVTLIRLSSMQIFINYKFFIKNFNIEIQLWFQSKISIILRMLDQLKSASDSIN